MSQVTKSPTRDPRAALLMKNLDTENYDYFPVQKDTKDFVSPLPDYLYKESIVEPGQPMYEIAADGEKDFKQRALAGAASNVLLRIRKGDRKALLQASHDEAIRRTKKKDKTPLKDPKTGQEFESETSTMGGILTNI